MQGKLGCPEARLKRGSACLLKTELVSKAQKLKVQFLKFAFEILGFDFSPQRLLNLMENREVILFVATVIGFALNPCSDQAQLLMERGDIDHLFFGASFPFNELFQFLARGKIFSLRVGLLGERRRFLTGGARMKCRTVGWKGCSGGETIDGEFLKVLGHTANSRAIDLPKLIPPWGYISIRIY